jgi:hypothetical protein
MVLQLGGEMAFFRQGSRRLGMRLAMVFVLVSLASAQVARPGRGRGAARENVPSDGPSAASLLQVVHEDAQQLAPTDRAAVLSRAIQTAQRVQPDQVLPWTEELFNLAPQIAEDRRASLELLPVLALANRDVDEALRLLERMDAPSQAMLDSGSDPRTSAASSVFSAYWGGRGPRFRRGQGADPDNEEESAPPAARQKAERTKKIERIRSIAAHLGSGGVYPYAGFSAPLEALKVQDPPAEEALFAELLNAFRSSPGRYADVAEFVRMLMNERSHIASPFYREALTMAVAAIDRIPVNSLPSMNFTYRGQGTSGQLSNVASLQLMRIVPLIKEVDPDWAKQVLEQHPDVAQFEQARSTPGTTLSTLSSSGMGAAANRSPQRQLAPVRAMSQNSPEGAKLFAQQITDPAARAAANAEVAAGLARQNAEEAANYFSQASQALTAIDDPASQLMVVTSLARAAFETGDRASAVVYSERGFRLGEDVVHADYDANPDKAVMSLKGVSDLTNLVNTAMRIDPAGTVNRIQAIRYPLLRSNLLLSAVDAVASRPNMRGSPPTRVSGANAFEVMDSIQSSGSTAQSVTVETRRTIRPATQQKPPE